MRTLSFHAFLLGISISLLGISCDRAKSPSSKTKGLEDVVTIIPDAERPGFLKVTCKDGSTQSVAADSLSSACAAKPTKKYKKLVANSDGIFCAIDNSDELTCHGVDAQDAGAYHLMNDIPPFLGKVKDIVISNNLKCAIRLDDGLVCWGVSSSRALESFHQENTLALNGSKNPAAKLVAVSENQICYTALKTNKLSCYGNVPDDPTPYEGKDLKVDRLAGGSKGFCAVYNGNQVECWGPNYSHVFPRDIKATGLAANGRVSCVADAKTVDCYNRYEHTLSDTRPIQGNVSSLSIFDMSPDTDKSDTFACVTYKDRPASCWGNNSFAQTELPSDLGIVKSMALSRYHACALNAQDGISCWKYGENKLFDFKSPGLYVGRVYAGGNTTCAQSGSMDVEGNAILNCWGEELGTEPRFFQFKAAQDLEENRLFIGKGRFCYDADEYRRIYCQGSADNPANITDMMMMSDIPDYKQVHGGDDFSCGLTLDGDVHCWGSYSPTLTAERFSARGAVQLAAGKSHACAIRNSGDVSCWGSNSAGQTSVPAALKASKLVAGDAYTCALSAEDNALNCWGRVPLSFPKGKTDIRLISSGAEHICVSNNQDLLQCFGDKGNRGIEQPRDLGSINQLVSGSHHSCAVRSEDNHLICWGSNNFGQINLPSTIATSWYDIDDTVLRGRLDMYKQSRNLALCSGSPDDEGPYPYTCNLPRGPVYAFSGFSFPLGAETTAVADGAYDLDLYYNVSCQAAGNWGMVLALVGSNGEVHKLNPDGAIDATGTLKFSNFKGPAYLTLRAMTPDSPDDSVMLPVFSGKSCEIYISSRPRVFPHDTDIMQTAASVIKIAMEDNSRLVSQLTALIHAENFTAAKVSQMLDDSINKAAQSVLKMMVKYPAVGSYLYEYQGASGPFDLDFVLNDISISAPGEVYGTDGVSVSSDNRREVKPVAESLTRTGLKDNMRLVSICQSESDEKRRNNCISEMQLLRAGLDKDLAYAVQLVSLSQNDFSGLLGETSDLAKMYKEKADKAMRNAKDLLDMAAYVKSGLEEKFGELYQDIASIFAKCSGENCYLAEAQQ